MDDTFSLIKKRVQDNRKFMHDIQSSELGSVKGEVGQTGLKDQFSYMKPIPDDLWVRCTSCQGVMLREDFEMNRSVCLHCGHGFRVNARDRLAMTVDEDSFEELWAHLFGKDPISFPRYDHRLRKLREKTGMTEAVIVGEAQIGGYSCMVGAMDSNFLMGSMGSAVGEKITRLFETATAKKLPVILFAASGGARMQEGIVSLMQMAKTAAAVERHSRAGLLYISVLTDPTTGGVTASFASLGDIILSEPDTLIGFAGRRVIEGTIAQALPDDFQRSEFLLKHGFLDMIVPRDDMRSRLTSILSLHSGEKQKSAEANAPRGRMPAMPKHRSSGSECLTIIRQKERPTLTDYLPMIFTDIHEVHGDRYYADDTAMFTGVARLNGKPVTVIGHRKGKSLLENQACNYGMPHPEGYRKALRAMKQAEKFNRPIITFVDTPGAYCGVGAEERGQGEAIARNLMEMMPIRVPIISLVIGEGGSGGALGIAVADELAMTSNAIYSVISPRGFASLVWKDPSRESEAADTADITAVDLKNLEICDVILPEPDGGAHAGPERMGMTIKTYLLGAVDRIEKAYQKDKDAALEARYQRFRKIGDCE